ncbi:MAG: hypothetical protein AAGC86_09805 [Pseudomonadota bacterium]
MTRIHLLPLLMALSSFPAAGTTLINTGAIPRRQVHEVAELHPLGSQATAHRRSFF